MALASPAPERTRISAVEMERYYCLLQAAARAHSLAAETTIPICAKDIGDDLRKELAFLSGGRGKNNGWIITFPENSHFNEASEEVLRKILTYLTAVPSQHESDTQFILILDRRLDTWTSVKMTLQRIAMVLPHVIARDMLRVFPSAAKARRGFLTIYLSSAMCKQYRDTPCSYE